MRHVLFALLMLLITLILLCCGAEAITRVFGGRPATFLYSGSFRDRQTDWDVTYGETVDNLRVTCGIPTPTPTRKFAVIGDSFAFGQGVADCQDWISQLQAIYPGARFVNYGIIGIGLDEYEMIARDMIPPDVTDIIMLFYGNDISEINDDKSVSGKLADVSSAFALLRRIKRTLSIKLFTANAKINETPPIFNNVQAILQGNSDYFLNVAQPPDKDLVQFQKRFSRLMGRFVALVPRDRIWIAEAPEATTISEQSRKFERNLGGALPIFGKPGSGYEEIRRLATTEKVHFIDLFPALLAAPDNLYFPHDLHWSANGHRLAADVIAASLRTHPVP
jgi:hypothetical protein